MITVKMIERLWKSKSYSTLAKLLLAGRPEASLRLEAEIAASPKACAALALVRLDELSQPHVPLYLRLLKWLLQGQEADGGWGDPLTTAICVRALLAGRGEGLAIDRGIFYLANLQKPEGIWPRVPFRRLPADAYVSAFILLQLGHSPRFRAAVRFIDALNWFDANEASLDGEMRRLWDHASARCQLQRADSPQTLMWS
jgi:hypothetical protein